MTTPRKTLPALVAASLLLPALMASLTDAGTAPADLPTTRRALLPPGGGVAQAIGGRLVTASFAGEGGRCVVALSGGDAARTVLTPARTLRLGDPAGGPLSLTCGHGAGRMLVERRDGSRVVAGGGDPSPRAPSPR